MIATNLMKQFFTGSLLLLSSSLYAQTLIQGKVTDNNGQPVPWANIFIENSYDGGTATETGEFRFETAEKGPLSLLAKSVGYENARITVRVEGKSVTVDIVLNELVSELNAITISAGAFTASDESRRTVFRPVDIATTAGATADIAGALNTLPGTQKVGESGRLFVRGGEGNETRTFIDGMVVLDAYGPAAPNTPSRGRFLPFMFKGTSFSTGGYSAEYGQALSAALVLDSRDESTSTRTDLGIMTVGADVAHTQAWDRGSIAGKIQYTNLRPYVGMIRQEIDWVDAPASFESVVAFRQRFGKHGMMKLYGNFNESAFSLDQHDVDDYSQTTRLQLNNGYRYVNASFKNPVNEKWMMRGGLSYSSIANDTKVNNVQINELERGLHGKWVFDGSISDRVELKSGVEVIHRDYKASEASTNFQETITSLFAESDLFASNRFVVRIGARSEFQSITHSLAVDPRLSLAVKTGDAGQVSLAYGVFRQTPSNSLLKLKHDLASEKSAHYIVNYQRISDNRTFRVEGYYKTYTDLVQFDGDGVTNTGEGYARGIEFFWRDNESIKRFDYWVSYSFLDTERKYLNYPISATPTFASRHNFSIVGKYFVINLKSQLGATFSYASGRPYFNPNEQKFLGSRTSSYQDLSFNWSYLPRPHIIVYVSCTNLLGRDNIFSYEFGDQQNEHGVFNSRPVRQAAPRFLFVGIFITLSKDKSVNQLPTL